MAVPGTGNWQAQILQGVGAPQTRANFNALDAWQRAEGGTALNNPFNTTQTMPGSTAYNQVAGTAGVQNYSTPGQGIAATINTLNNGRYGGIIDALRAGNNPQAVASAVGASPWGTSGSLMSQILGGPSTPAPSMSPTPQATLPASTLPAGPSLPMSVTSPMMGLGVLGGLQSGNLAQGIMQGLEMGGQMPGLGTAFGAPKGGAPKTSVPLGGAPKGGPAPQVTTTKLADPIGAGDLTSVGSLHPTEGLPGFPAHDFFAPAGSPAVAPVTGTIVKLSGNNPADGPTEGPHGPFGWSVYVQGDNGRTYYMTHMGSYAKGVAVGQTVKAGQPLGTVGDYAKYGTPSHIHMGVSAPGVQVS